MVAWALSRLLLLATALVVAASHGWRLADVLGNWDVKHFATIATQGYAPDPQEMAFFPGLPVLMRAGAVLGLAPVWSGVLLALVGSALAAWALARLAGTGAAVAWLFAPTAIFTAVGYTEALFCAAAFWAWERARADRWAQAAVLAALASTLRVSGLFLVGALALLALSWPPVRDRALGVRVRAALVRGAWLLLPVAVIGGYAVYLWTLTGSWTAWYSAQEAGWQRTFTLPWDAVRATLDAVRPGGYADQHGWGMMFRFELVSFVVGLLTTGWMLRRRRWGEAGWVGVQVLAFSLSPWLMSVNRAVLLWFPTWSILGEVAAHPAATRSGRLTRRLLVGGYALGSVVTMVWWAWKFGTGQWAS
ncbi:Mannosyltransferase (PIG-V) [Raineyella antarctica]|uniref:Mannosyltransferase (PIG-V) n=1 Tax=Raineyella antarctica TaxID=1577474 RepID=A0A1G6HQK0_9ACTN|nr:Mannosyltransferase (PIG-V) [Raineyella antarctica]